MNRQSRCRSILESSSSRIRSFKPKSLKYSTIKWWKSSLNSRSAPQTWKATPLFETIARRNNYSPWEAWTALPSMKMSSLWCRKKCHKTSNSLRISTAQRTSLLTIKTQTKTGQKISNSSNSASSSNRMMQLLLEDLRTTYNKRLSSRSCSQWGRHLSSLNMKKWTTLHLSKTTNNKANQTTTPLQYWLKMRAACTLRRVRLNGSPVQMINLSRTDEHKIHKTVHEL